MKTTYMKIIVFVVFLFSHVSIYAQYQGGNSDGATLDLVTNTSCSSLPPSFFAFLGGNSDGASVNDLLNASCGTAPFQYAFLGGNNDGASVETIEVNACAFPPSFYVFFGGNSDGAVVDATAPVCPTDPPVADFTASVTTICVGQSVTFTDTSTNLPFVWAWTFTGGTPNSSTVQNPTITYNTAGTYEVALVATNFNGNDTETKTAFITVVAIPTITSTTPASRCDAGTVTLQATASAGTISWFANSSGGTALATGTSFITPSISTTTTYYVESANGSCISTRIAVIATVNIIPTIISTTPNERCGTGTIILGATSSVGGGIPFWYAAATGGTALATTNNFVTPSLNATTTYYVEASNGICTSTVRTAVVATINTVPTITGTTPATRCDAGTVTLGASASAGTISWFANASGGTALGTGTSFTTPSLSTTTTYYVESATATCTSTRTAVTATINVTPSITGTTPSSVCDSGTVTLGASASAGTISWFANASGGTVLATGTSFTTPSLSTTTTYYVESANGSCVSTRTAVIATVNTTPSVTSTLPGSRCDTGSVNISATISAEGHLAASYNWYDVATGGTAIGHGNSFNTPIISTTTTYYIEAVNGTCVSPRTAVVATINTTPSITDTTPSARCDAGTLTLGATASIGTISWFANSSGGTALGTGISFTTPSLSTTTTYYVESSTATCTSTRTAVIATINVTPSITGTTPSSVCDSGTVTLQASASGGTISWFANSSGGTALGTGTSFTTPSLSTTTTYYVESANGSCTSARTAVTATVVITTAPTGNANQTFCNGETVGNIVVVGTNITWYDAPTGGNVVLASALIANNTTYYASQTDNGCESSSMLAVTMTNGGCLYNEEFIQNIISIYPNPVQDILNIKSSSTIERVEIHNLLGQMIFNSKYNNDEVRIDFSNYSTGTYLIRVFNDNSSKTYKIIKD